jgi:hypothetical protein
MVSAIRVNSSMERNMEKVYTIIAAERYMMGSGIKIVNTDLDCTPMPMEKNTKEIG